MKRALIYFLSGCLLLLLLVRPAHAARTQTFNGNPIEIKANGTHYRVLGYDIASTPLPKFAYDDHEEVERYLIVHMQAIRGDQQEYTDTIRAYNFEIWNGPNHVYPSDAKLSTKKYPQLTKQLLTEATEAKFKIKPGQTRNFDTIFVINPVNSIKLSFDDDEHSQYVWLHHVTSKNNVTAD
ncbi:hypothetical protein [Loigolactobacillus binensis]|uniref:Uncharacterized protein n=1 Tax=Loigolactobacillus binensis TaxID=2559922 RepID=A0ABW3EA45_9LACO|nr:hypothetical protein [Loigolactobacillus binensis]